MTARKTARPIIQLKKLTKIYGIGDAAHDALDEIDLTIPTSSMGRTPDTTSTTGLTARAVRSLDSCSAVPARAF